MYGWSLQAKDRVKCQRVILDIRLTYNITWKIRNMYLGNLRIWED